ncbi:MULTISPECIES: YqgQ family protein [Staphylococcus]|uniref:YqgQ family protein n=1 Tax=Staphylococcus TaxID=1279 RepID=UPI000D03FBFA|nr:MULTISPECIES: YqgQ family protein [Staphylococcus]MCD8915028.1 YqgQ family protein [Staphylococcus simulans]UXV33832.1 YqgQ family protein [Staphylococcus sp. IVB6181]
MNRKIDSFYDVQQLLKQFGFIVYFKNKSDMYEMMEQEIRELYEYQLISKDAFIKCILIINQRRMNK